MQWAILLRGTEDETNSIKSRLEDLCFNYHVCDPDHGFIGPVLITECGVFEKEKIEFFFKKYSGYRDKFLKDEVSPYI